MKRITSVASSETKFVVRKFNLYIAIAGDLTEFEYAYQFDTKSKAEEYIHRRMRELFDAEVVPVLIKTVRTFYI